MAQIEDLDVLFERRTELGDGQKHVVPLVEADGVRVRLIVTKSGTWPAHREDNLETYVVLRGAVHYRTDRDFTVRAGQMVTFASGEMHQARIEEGALSINIERKGSAAR